MKFPEVFGLNLCVLLLWKQNSSVHTNCKIAKCRNFYQNLNLRLECLKKSHKLKKTCSIIFNTTVYNL